MQFGYSYPELQPWQYRTTTEYLLSIYTDIAKLYRVTADDISDSCKKSKTAWGGLVPNRSDLGKNIIVHHDYVINVRYGKCVTPPSLALPCILIRDKLTFLPKIRPRRLTIQNTTLPTPTTPRRNSYTLNPNSYTPDPNPYTPDPNPSTLNSRPNSASIIGWDFLHRQRLQFLDCNRSSRHKHSLR